jgi:ribose 1,5-bisphosphokinase
MIHGRLIYVMGASGAGKDSVIGEAKRRLGHNTHLAFASRYITRPADAGGEAHIAVRPQEFADARHTGFFALDWDSHGLSYGIGWEIEDWMATGMNVVVNGSREYLPTAAQRYPTILPMLIEVALDVLRARLTARGRETSANIDARLSRAMAQADVDHPALVRIRNDGPLAATVDEFLAVLGISETVR